MGWQGGHANDARNRKSLYEFNTILTFEQARYYFQTGEGSYSSVYQVRRLYDHQQYALKKVKITSLSSKEKENALNQVRLLASVNHPSIIAYRQAFLDEACNSLCIIMEYADDGDVYQLINHHRKKKKYIKEEDIWRIIIQVIHGLNELHFYKILHRDIKSANIFLTKDGKAKLGDMNVSKIAKKGLLETQTGTPYYASPEVWNERPYNHKSDIWSLGCVLYEMCALKPPFRAENMEELYKKINRGFFQKLPTYFSPELSQLIRDMLIVNPNHRPSCQELLSYESIKSRDPFNEKSGSNSIMMKTIRIPKNMYYLTDMLPRPNYDNTNNQDHAKSPTKVLNPSISLPHVKPGENLYEQAEKSRIKEKSIRGNRKGNRKSIDRGGLQVQGLKMSKGNNKNVLLPSLIK